MACKVMKHSLHRGAKRGRSMGSGSVLVWKPALPSPSHCLLTDPDRRAPSLTPPPNRSPVSTRCAPAERLGETHSRAQAAELCVSVLAAVGC